MTENSIQGEMLHQQSKINGKDLLGGKGEDSIPSQNDLLLFGFLYEVAQPPELGKMKCLQMCRAPDLSCPSVPADVQRVAGPLFT